MKRNLWKVTLICMLCMAFAACGNGDSETNEPTSTPVPTSTSTPTPEPTPTEVPVAVDDYVKGTITASGFESEWMKLRFTAPADAVMATQEEMDALMGLSADMFYGDNADAFLAYAQLTTVIEMQATWIYGVPVVQVMVEKPVYDNLTAEQYLSMLVYSLQSISGITYTIDENLYAVEIAGQEYINLGVAADYGTGIPVYQDYCVRKQGERIICIIFTYLDGFEGYLQNVLDAFSEY